MSIIACKRFDVKYAACLTVNRQNDRVIKQETKDVVFLMADKSKQVILTCTVCLNRNYTTSRTKANAGQRLELMKYCKHCNKKTLHKETK